nr:MAG TPA: hypothetical protein [Caudoviricetes sp.]
MCMVTPHYKAICRSHHASLTKLLTEHKASYHYSKPNTPP